MAKYADEQRMMFKFLDLDYDRPWANIDEIISLNMGDYRFEIIKFEQLRTMAMVMWSLFHGKGIRHV